MGGIGINRLYQPENPAFENIFQNGNTSNINIGLINIISIIPNPNILPLNHNYLFLFKKEIILFYYPCVLIHFNTRIYLSKNGSFFVVFCDVPRFPILLSYFFSVQSIFASGSKS